MFFVGVGRGNRRSLDRASRASRPSARTKVRPSTTRATSPVAMVSPPQAGFAGWALSGAAEKSVTAASAHNISARNQGAPDANVCDTNVCDTNVPDARTAAAGAAVYTAQRDQFAAKQ
jgi:hypothetical protein